MLSLRANNNQGALTVRLDIISDIVCPWCWLGARYLQSAIAQSEHEVEVNWHPYMLDPTVPAEGVPYSDYMKAKFGNGPSDRFKAMRQHLEEAAPDAGIRFRFDDISIRPNTMDAHRLMRWAQGQNKATECAEQLFKAFFDDLRDVGDKDVLIDIAQNIGLDPNVVSDLLSSDSDKALVQNELEHIQKLGIRGVPCFIYNNQIAVQGAQPIEAHLETLNKAASVVTTLGET